MHNTLGENVHEDTCTTISTELNHIELNSNELNLYTASPLLGWRWGAPVLVTLHVVFPSCVFPVSSQEISLPPRVRALSHSKPTSAALATPLACFGFALQVALLLRGGEGGEQPTTAKSGHDICLPPL